jgi:replicative DNA helicase
MQSRRKPARNQDAPEQPAMLLDIELEAELIGAVLDDNTVLKQCAYLTADHFSDPIHAEIWEHILYLRTQARDATLSTIAIDLGEQRLSAIGGREFLAGLTIRGHRAKSIVTEAALRVRDLSQWRRLRALSTDIHRWTETGNLTSDEAITTAIEELKLVLSSGGSRAKRKSEVAEDALAIITGGREPVPTGITSLDFLTHGGLMAGRTYGFLGLYGRGKTIFVGSISENLNVQGVNHLVISLETPPEDMEIRNCARRIGLNAAQLYDRDDPLWKDFAVKAGDWSKSIADHTWYEFAPAATIDEIERMIIRAIHLFGIKGVFIDYWQLIEGREKGQNLAEHLKTVANRISNLARKEGIWIVVMAQADENGEARDCKSGLHTALTMVMRMVRGENDDTAYFETMKSNHTRYAATGDSSEPGMIFDFEGPHFRSAGMEDHPLVERDAA